MVERSVQPSVDQFIDTVEAMALIETTIADVVGYVHTHERLPGKPDIAPVDIWIVLLKEHGGDRVLPICVARSDEGFRLVAQLAGGTFSRSVTEDLAARLIELSGADRTRGNRCLPRPHLLCNGDHAVSRGVA